MRIPISILCVILGLAACTGPGPDRQSELEELLVAEDYEEILARTAVYLEADEETAWVYYARGVALIRGENADVPAKRAFVDAAALQPNFAHDIAESWRLAAVADAEANWGDRAARRMREAFRYNNDVDLDPVASDVADLLYRHEEKFEKAFLVYSRLILRTASDERKQQQWLFRYGHCLDRMGDINGALAAYTDYKTRWPSEMQVMRYVLWRYQLIHLDQSELALAEGRYDDSLEWAVGAFVEDWNMDLQQRARVRAGLAHEARTEYEEAMNYYRQVIDDGATFGGEAVEDAKNRIDALATLGVH